LTKGQASPTSDLGLVTKTTPTGVSNTPLNPLVVAIVMGCTFVGRGYTGEEDHLTQLIKKGITHKGFALIDILQPCVSFNHVNTYQWYSKRVYKINEETYDLTDKFKALKKGLEWGDKIPIGILYKVEKTTFEENFPILKDKPLIKQKIAPHEFKDLLNEFI
jgi:2-oxoglutarate ferredoxin oxidoreductase subunit beta